MTFLPVPVAPHFANGLPSGNFSAGVTPVTVTLASPAANANGIVSWSGGDASKIAIVRTGEYLVSWKPSVAQVDVAGNGWLLFSIYKNGALLEEVRVNASSAYAIDPSVFYRGSFAAGDALQFKVAAYAEGFTITAASSPWEVARWSVQQYP